METLIGIIIGLFVGGLLFYIYDKRIRRKQKPSGRFVMDFSDPTKDICRLELDEDLNSIYTKKSIMLDIVAIGSQD